MSRTTPAATVLPPNRSMNLPRSFDSENFCRTQGRSRVISTLALWPLLIKRGRFGFEPSFFPPFSMSSMNLLRVATSLNAPAWRSSRSPWSMGLLIPGIATIWAENLVTIGTGFSGSQITEPVDTKSGSMSWRPSETAQSPASAQGAPSFATSNAFTVATSPTGSIKSRSPGAILPATSRPETVRPRVNDRVTFVVTNCVGPRTSYSSSKFISSRASISEGPLYHCARG
mmetsp:Transcript_25725/g.64262  ORF Transcript_25725/g.64262 Transcript_25725/m.64262 type:complete len:229 (+) Transcript_25725:121-807(+)